MERFKRAFFAGMVLLSVLATVLSVVGMILDFRSGKRWQFEASVGVGFLLGACLAAFAAIERKKLRWLALLGILIALPSMVAWPVYVWILDSNIYAWVWLRPPVATGMVAAGLFCFTAFVLAPPMRLIGRLLQWVTVLSMCCAATFLQVLIWGRWSHTQEIDTAWMVSAVLSAGGAIAVWAWNRMSAISVPEWVAAEVGSARVRCPRCRIDQEIDIGRSRCAGCGLQFRFEMAEPKCLTCGYNLPGLTGEKCPECGTVFVVKAVDPNAELLAWARANDAVGRDQL